MTRTFLHSFDPAAANPIPGATVSLDVSDIEDAGIREVLQTPGAAYGAWSILDALLSPTGAGTPFIFREPLGQPQFSPLLTQLPDETSPVSKAIDYIHRHLNRRLETGIFAEFACMSVRNFGSALLKDTRISRAQNVEP